MDEVEIALVNSCGELVLTKLSKDESSSTPKDFIDVSLELGDLIQAYVNDGDTPLLDYLVQDADVDFFEKLEFYQRYGLRNEKLDFDYSDFKLNLTNIEEKEREIWNGLKSGNGGDEVYKCQCDFISIVRKHSHFEAIPGGDPEGWYYRLKQEIIDDTDVETVQDRGEFWKDLQALGASKWLSVNTQGWKRNKQIGLSESHHTGDTSQVNSGMRGTITIMLLCMDGEELPESCS